MFDQTYSGDAAIAASQSVKERKYWLEKLSGELVKSSFPYDNNESLSAVSAARNMERIDVYFKDELFSRLITISNQSDTRLLTVLATGVMALLAKYTGSRDIIIGMPIYKQKVTGDFINTVVPLRCQIQENLTFKNLLYQVKQTIDEAVKHQNYPLKTLLYDLNLSFSGHDFPLFDNILIMKNIQDPSYSQHIPVNIEFIFFRTLEYLEVTVQYNRLVYDQETIKRILCHFSQLLKAAIFNVDLSLSEIDILTAEEKKQLLCEFNQFNQFNRTQTVRQDDLKKTLYGLFAEQVEKTPDETSLIFIPQDQYPVLLTYRQLDEKAGELAFILKEKGFGARQIAALLIESSLHMATAVLAVLKAGGAYLPIDVEAPQDRKMFTLKDSGVQLLLTGSAVFYTGIEGLQQLDISAEFLYTHNTHKKDHAHDHEMEACTPGDPAYVIYTSGSTGRPKGVIVEHRQAVNTLVCRREEYLLKPGHTALQLFSYAFDGFITSFFTPIISGARLILLSKDTIQDISKIVDVIYTFKVTHFISVPVLFQALINGMTAEEAASLQVVTLAGDKVQSRLPEMAAAKNKNIEVVNEYGVTEAAVMSTIYRRQERDRRIKIGHPICNTSIYITKGDGHQHLAPIGVFGEMSITGAGVTRGYLNNPELTAEKFVYLHHSSFIIHHSKLYCTGDLARWLPDGNIEYRGRADFQVKVRGFRIELGEIERQLLTHMDINETIVTALQNNDGDKYLCAYITTSRELSPAELREYLTDRLPDYMIPAYFVMLEKMPLSPNGKVDRKQLPPPAVSMKSGGYMPPRDWLDNQLLEIWAEILGIDKSAAGIDADFFQLGGHSLTATLMSNRIYKELNVKVPMVEIFKSPQIRHLAQYIKAQTKEKYIAIHPAEKKSYYAVSSAQLRLYILQQMEPDAVIYNIPMMNRLEGDLQKERLESAFQQLIARHESFRTSFSFVEGNPVQVIHEVGEIKFNIEYYDVQDGVSIKEAAAAIFQKFVRPFDISKAPLLRAAVISENPRQHILLVDIHHILTDIIAFNIVIDNFLALYNGKELAPLKIQFKDYAEWEHSKERENILNAQEKYWLQEFSGEIPVLNLPTDFPRAVQQNFAGNVISFRLDQEETAALERLVHDEGITLFMTVLGLFNIFLSKITGSEEIVVGTAAVIRKHADLEQVFGIFLNMLALKNRLEKDITARQFFKKLKENTLAAFENQDYPYETLVEKITVERDLSRNPLFDATIMYQKQVDAKLPAEAKENQMQGLKVSSYPFDTKMARYDLTLDVVELGEKGHLNFQFEYAVSLFKEETILRFIDYFKHMVSSVTQDPGVTIGQVEILPMEERRKLLIDFNATDREYPRDKTICQLIAWQVLRTPAAEAIIFEDQRFSYLELENTAVEIAHYLTVEMNIQPGDLVGILMERSIYIIPAMLGIMIAGGAYVAVDAALPAERITHIAGDAGIAIFISETKHSEILKSIQGKCPAFRNILYLDDRQNTAPVSRAPQLPAVQSFDLAYVAYTSGTTGVPKGIMIEHRSLVNFIMGITACIDFSHNDTLLSLTTISFDIFGLESLLPLTCGAKVVIGNNEEQVDDMALTAALVKHGVTILQVTPSRLQIILTNDTSGRKLASLRYLLVGGETFPEILLAKARDVVKGKIYNLYGPTETTIWSTAKDVSGKESLNIGRPIANTKIYILDNRQQLIPTGTVGELCIGGDGLARGYFKNETLTREKFIANPFCPGERIYRTGDLARWLSNGEIECFGRVDNQVKIRGFRIEPEEIENRLLEIENVEKAAIVEYKETNGGNYLCAYIVSAKKMIFSEIRQALARVLPDYMIPAYFMQLEKIPLSPAGKINRKALPVPTVHERGAYIGPRTLVEKKLAAIWCEELNLDRVSIDANFFQLGGHSLKAATMCAHVHKELEVKVSIIDVFKNPTIKGLAERISNLASDKFTIIEPAEKKEYYPLSPAQERLYFLQQFDAEGITYNLPFILPLEKEINEKKLVEAFRKLIARHGSLRTSFEIIVGGAVQRIYDDVELEVGHYEIEDKGELENVIQDFVRSFDLRCVPLMRVSLVKVFGTERNETQQILLFDMHHIISDGMSQVILSREFMELYSGKELPPLRLQYRDYSEWRHRLAVQGVFKPQEDYWLQQFAGKISLVNLPYDYPRPEVQSFDGSVFRFALAEEETKALNEIARTRGMTLFMVLLAAYNIFLFKLSQQEDIVVGSPVAGRRHTDLEQVIGMFVNMLALRNNPSNEKKLVYFLEEIRENTLAAFDNQDLPFEDLVEKVDITRDLSRNPLFDTAFILQNFYDAPAETSTTLKFLDYKGRVSRFDLSLIVSEAVGKLDLTFEYCTRLFREETIERFTGYFKKIIDVVIENPSVKISGIDILSQEEMDRVLYEFNQTAVDYPRGKTIHELFHLQAAKAGDRIALTGMGHFLLSYRELNEQSARLAYLLIKKGVKLDTIVGIMTEPSVGMIIGILGILKAGGAYLPIEPGYPEERIDYMLKDSGAKLLVTTNDKEVEKVRSWQGEQIFLEFIIHHSNQLSIHHSSFDIPRIHHSSHLAYVIYTSGTTGKPKGVLIEHRNVVRLFFNDKFQFDFSHSDTWTLFHSFCFDFSAWEMYGALLNGGKLVVIPKLVARDSELYLDTLKAEQVTILNQTPSAFYNLMDPELKNPQRQLHLRYVIFGGEALKLKRLKGWKAMYPEIKLINMYGITETTVHVTFKEIGDNEIESEVSNMGKPIPTLSTYVMDKNFNLQPIGTTGELVVGGEGVGRGYLNRPELTEAKFVKNPHISGERLYKSGDLVILSPGGDLHYLGRIDSQVKLRGFRIELGEIENQLSRHEQIKEAVVAARENESGDKYLCAYIVSDHKLNVSQLKAYLVGKLPDYMIPSHFSQIDQVLLTPNGKLDIKALDSSSLKLDSGVAYREPQNEMEKLIVEVWKQVLNLDKVGIYDNFFDVGGNSLNIIKIRSALNERLGRDIPIVHLLTYTTIESLSRYLKQEEEGDVFSDTKIEAAVEMMEDAMQMLRGDNDE